MTRASTAGVAARRALQTERRALVVEYVRLYPSMTTDDLAERLGWDRSTIRRDRAALRAGAAAEGDQVVAVPILPVE